MKPKKNPNAEIGRNSSLYFMIGLTSVLFMTWQSFEVKFYDEESKVSEVVGKLIAERSVKKGVKEVYFDRGKYKYHGRIKLLAETARKEGLKF